MMNGHKKVTYTLSQRVINIIERGSFLSDLPMSRWLSNCIQYGYSMMVDDYYDNGKQPLVGLQRKRSGTIPKTFTLPTDVVETLCWFSEKLQMKKSHIVAAAVLNYQRAESERLSLQIKELMESAEND